MQGLGCREDLSSLHSYSLTFLPSPFKRTVHLMEASRPMHFENNSTQYQQQRCPMSEILFVFWENYRRSKLKTLNKKRTLKQLFALQPRSYRCKPTFHQVFHGLFQK